MLFSGFLCNISSVVWPFRAVAFINPVRYAFAAAMRSEYDGLRFYCPPAPGACPWHSGEQVLSTIDLGSLSIGLNVLVVFCIFVAIRVAGVVALNISISRELARRL